MGRGGGGEGANADTNGPTVERGVNPKQNGLIFFDFCVRF